MIERIDSPSNSDFYYPATDYRRPYYRKYTTPISVVKYADTIYNVRNKGFNVAWYQDSVQWKSTVFAGRAPFIKFYHGNGYPEVFNRRNFTTNWGMQYKGYMRAPYTGTYYFYAGGEGTVQYLYVNGTHIMSGRSLHLNNQEYEVSSSLAFTGGSWYSFDMRYAASNLSNRPSGLVLLWQTDVANTPEKIVLSAGIVNDATHIPNAASTYCLALSTVNYCNNIQYTQQADNITKLVFEVPFIHSNDPYNAKGYFYSPSQDAFIEKSTYRSLKKYRMIEYSEGYQYRLSGVDYPEYVTKFTGQIRDFDINYNPGQGDVLRVTCYDYGIFTKDVVNLVAPTPIDYWQVGYIDKIYSKANGVTKPRAFDGWEIHRAYQVMLTESFIDPWTFYQKKIFSTASGGSTAGSYYIEPIKSSVQSYLPIKSYYGNTAITADDDSTPDDNYAYKVNTGEFYKDAIDNITKSWYYKWGVNRYGYPYLNRVNVPITYKDDRAFTYYGTWVSSANVEAFKGTYKEGTYPCSARATIRGNKIVALVGTGPRFGSANGTTPSFSCIIRRGNNFVSSAKFNAYDSTAHFYYSGPNTSNVNKSYLTLARNLPYHDYTVVIRSINGNYKTAVDGFLGFDNDNEYPRERYYTSDLHTSGNISELQVQQNIDDHRTDCVVLGSLTGTRVVSDEMSNYSASNPNNPIYTYVQSNSRDLDSIYTHSASNYVGHPRTTLIFDPSILSQDQADFISYNFISEYNTPKKQVSFTIQGNPLLEEGDCIAVSDDYKKAVSTANYLWVNQITNDFSDGKYVSRINTSPVKPVNSFWEKPYINLNDSAYQGRAINNFKIYNRGALATCRVALSSAYTTRIWISTNTAYLPPRGYFKHLNEIIKYNSVSTANVPPYALIGLTRAINSTAGATSIPYNAQLNISYDPYTQESMGYAPIVKFDCLVSGELEVSIHHFDDNNANQISGRLQSTRVDVLTGIGKDDLSESYENVIWGKNKQFLWGGFDRIGNYNNAVSGNKIGKGYYVGEKYWWGTPNSTYGKFYVQVKVRPYDKTQKVEDFVSYMHGDVNNKFIYTRRGEVGNFDIYFSTAAGNLYCVTASPRGGTGNYDAYTFTPGNLFANALNVSTYPTVTRDKTYNVFALKRSNDYRGFKFKLQNYLPVSKDAELVRNYYLNMQYNILQLGWAQTGELDPAFIFHAKNYSGAVSDLIDANERIGSQSFYFNPADIALKDENFSFVPREFINAFINIHKESDGKIPSADRTKLLLMNNAIFFTENVRDRSGRRCNQPRAYTITKPLDSIIWYFNAGERIPGFGDDRLDFLQANNALPFRFPNLSSTHGFYEFLPEKPKDHWQIAKSDGSPFDGTFPGNDVYFKKHLSNEARFGRTNYITWFDENSVKKMLMFDAGYHWYNSLYVGRSMFGNDPNLIVPNIWARYELQDFTSDFK